MKRWECPLCSCGESRRLFDSIDLTGASAGIWSIVQCHGCSLHSLSPRPSRADLLAFYSSDYEPFWGIVDEESNWARRWLRRRHCKLRCRLVQRACPQGRRLLDLGCATGNFLRELRRNGQWQAIGTDINRGALVVASRQGVFAWCGESDALCLPTACCDVVTLWDVIEHVPEPRATLLEVHRILRPRGTLLLSTPNGTSWQARLWHRYWAGWEVPRHLQIFSPQTLNSLLRDSGFEVVRRVFLPMERFYLVQSALHWLSRRGGGRMATTAAQLARACGLLAWSALRLADHLPAAAALALEARKLP